MPATLDDLLYVAAAIRVDARAGFAAVAEAVRRPKGGGGGDDDKAKQGPGAKLAKGASDAQRNLSAFIDTFDKAIHSLGGGVSKFVALANPAAVYQFDLAMRDAMATLGRALVPALQRLTVMVRSLGDAFASLSPQARQLVAGLGLGSGLAGVLSVVVVAARTLFASLGFLPSLLLSVVGAFAGVAATMSSGKEIGRAFRGVLQAVGTVIEVLARTVLPVVEAVVVPAFQVLAAVLQGAAGAVLELVNAARQLFGFEPLDYDPAKRSSVGAAVRQAQVGDLRGYANRIYASAYMSSSGAAHDIPREQLNQQRISNSWLARIAKATGDAVRGGAAGADGSPGSELSAGGAVAGALGGAALGSVIPGVGTAVGAVAGGLWGSGAVREVRDRLARFFD